MKDKTSEAIEWLSKTLGQDSFNLIKLRQEASSRSYFRVSAEDASYILSVNEKNSEQAAKEAFSGNSLGANLPKVNIHSKKIEEKINIVEFVLLSKLESSKSEIRRLLKGNAVKINHNVISDEKFEINKNLFKDNYLKLSLGKKRHIKIELN